ncbi:TetR family transcriptional regulator [Fulvivirga sediminis]|uniref:TetR/AcrR family transcriptional regulator n=1 Tax=Fulvivirga sediminis TaxID=2803949 RepID=A0A937FAZ2_9BACT|nr:TetR family transcriptional regulator [Fulvivirga sediminis]MBL3657854.1 TetR/AcrR family transcriptional regulator [Fulvivirga sediminis]
MSKDKILKAADMLFVEKGFDATSIRELAQEAEVNIAMISYYFGSKESLLEEIIAKRLFYTRERIEEYKKMDIPAIELLFKLIDLYVDRILSHKKFNMMLHRELSLSQRHDLHERILDGLELNWNEIKKVVTDGQNGGVFKKEADVEMVIMTIFGLINQCTQGKITEKLIFRNKEEQDLKPRLKRHLKSILSSYLLEK